MQHWVDDNDAIDEITFENVEYWLICANIVELFFYKTISIISYIGLLLLLKLLGFNK